MINWKRFIKASRWSERRAFGLILLEQKILKSHRHYWEWLNLSTFWLFPWARWQRNWWKPLYSMTTSFFIALLIWFLFFRYSCLFLAFSPKRNLANKNHTKRIKKIIYIMVNGWVNNEHTYLHMKEKRKKNLSSSRDFSFAFFSTKFSK